MSFTVVMDPEKSRKKSGKNFAVTPVSLTYKNKKMETYFEPLIPMSVAFIVPGTDLMIPIPSYNRFPWATDFMNRFYTILQC